MRHSRIIPSAMAACVAAMFLAGCATAPKTPEERKSLVQEADATLGSMMAKDDTLRSFLDRSHGYVVFPSVGKGGFIAGGAYGRGVVYERGRPIGFAELNQGSIGAQIGGQTYSELIALENEDALARLRSGNFDLGGNLSAVALKAGAAGEARFEGGVAVFVQPKGGLMAEASISGQKINFQPMSDSEAREAAKPVSRPGQGSAGGTTSSGGSASDATSETNTGSGTTGAEVDVDVDVDRQPQPDSDATPEPDATPDPD